MKIVSSHHFLVLRHSKLVFNSKAHNIDVMLKLLNWFQRTLNRRAVEDNQIVLEEDDGLDLFNPFPEPVALEIRDVIDLHAFAPRDVKMVVTEYLREARDKGFRSVRLIHGKGKFVQRATVHEILARTDFVRSWTDAPPEAGGTGATIAHFRSSDQK